MTKNCTMRDSIFKITDNMFLNVMCGIDVMKVIKYIISMYNYLSVWINLVIVKKKDIYN